MAKCDQHTTLGNKMFISLVNTLRYIAISILGICYYFGLLIPQEKCLLGFVESLAV